MLVSFFALSAFAFALAKETWRKQQLMKEINQLQEEASRIEKENSKIKDKIAYFESRDFREKEAKDKLNLQDSGESLVVVKPSLFQGTQLKTEEVELSVQEKSSQVSNPLKWWNHFFKY